MSFKEKLRNILRSSLEEKQDLNLEQNLNQSIIDTQRKIKKDKNFIFIEKNPSMKKVKTNLNSKFEQFSIINNHNNSNKTDTISNYRNTSRNNINKSNIYNKIDLETLNLNEIKSNINPQTEKYDINKKYKNLYNKSYLNINNSLLNKNKTYLNYKNSQNYLLNNYRINKINKLSNLNINIYNNNNYKKNKLTKRCSSISSKNIILKNDNFYMSKLPQNYFNKKTNNVSNINKSNLNYLEIYDNFMNDNSKKENDAFIIKNKKRISNSIKKKINLIFGENDLEKASYKNNISNKLPRTLTSDLYQFDYNYYNDISPITKFLHLKNEKNKTNLKNYYKLSNLDSFNHLFYFNKDSNYQGGINKNYCKSLLY